MNKYLIDQYKILHATDSSYGPSNSARRDKKDIIDFFNKHSCKTVLDFGCGKGKLIEVLNNSGFECKGYDPALPQFETFPSESFDAVVCTDVLEHLDETLNDELKLILSVSPKCIYFNVAFDKARMLPDGKTPRHSLMKPPAWWLEKLQEFYSDYSIEEHHVAKGAAISVVIKLIKNLEKTS